MSELCAREVALFTLITKSLAARLGLDLEALDESDQGADLRDVMPDGQQP